MAALCQGPAQFVAWATHQRVMLAATLDDPRLDAAGSVGDLVGGDPFQHRRPQRAGIPNRPVDSSIHDERTD
jgi:hypothetical protein